jgi:hypothetical protein
VTSDSQQQVFTLGQFFAGPHQEIVVAYRAGSAAIPVSYAFPAGI